MGMQIHFKVADIPSAFKVRKRSDRIDDDDDDDDGGWYVDSYIVVDPGSLHFRTDKNHTSAWFDCGSTTQDQLDKIVFLIRNRICFNAS